MKKNIVTQVLEELTSEGINNVKPVALVGKINTKVQARNPKESELTAIIQEIYIRIKVLSEITCQGGQLRVLIFQPCSLRYFIKQYMSNQSNNNISESQVESALVANIVYLGKT